MRLAARAAIAALTGVAVAASQDPATVYILRREQDVFSDSVPRLPRQIARQVLLQRIGADHDSLLDDLPDHIDQETAVSYIKQLGVTPQPLFVETSSSGRPVDQPAQAVLLIEGITPQDLKSLQATLSKAKRHPSFLVRDPPSAKANRYLLDVDLARAGVAPEDCSLDKVDPFLDQSCFTDDIFVGIYDAQKSGTLKSLEANIPHWIAFAEQSGMEATLILLPESSRASNLAYWTTGPPTKRHAARAAGSESVMVDDPTSKPKNSAAAGGDEPNFHIWAADTGKKVAIPECFASFNSCVARTGNCTGGHGECVDKYAVRTGDAERRRAADEPPPVCFRCRCWSTLNETEDGGKRVTSTHWGGDVCQKIDVSVPFWLLTGFSVAIIGALTFAIGLLFSVGQETLPGVIGAGVSRTK